MRVFNGDRMERTRATWMMVIGRIVALHMPVHSPPAVMTCLMVRIGMQVYERRGRRA
jgi:hypothetical protein